MIPITLAELPLHQYISQISQVIDYEQHGNGWKPEWDDSMRVHPEAKSAAYDILVNSKSFFLYNASVCLANCIFAFFLIDLTNTLYSACPCIVCAFVCVLSVYQYNHIEWWLSTTVHIDSNKLKNSHSTQDCCKICMHVRSSTYISRLIE